MDEEPECEERDMVDRSVMDKDRLQVHKLSSLSSWRAHFPWLTACCNNIIAKCVA